MFGYYEAKGNCMTEAVRHVLHKGWILAECDCQMIECVCEVKHWHHKNCLYARAVCCAVPIECELHGFDVCPTCDPCTCEKEEANEQKL